MKTQHLILAMIIAATSITNVYLMTSCDIQEVKEQTKQTEIIKTNSPEILNNFIHPGGRL